MLLLPAMRSFLPKDSGIIIRRRFKMPIPLDGSSLTIEKLVAIARNNEKVELTPEA
jgi:hypothetical protein